ncbi:MAG: diguanylate cyclase [Sandaracinaceae bacterium]
MDERLAILTRLARRLTGRLTFEQTLQEVTDHAAEVLGAERVSLYLLDASGTRLMAVTRAGQPHFSEPQSFTLGRGLLGWIVQHGEPIRLDQAMEDPRFETRIGMRNEIASFLGVPLVAGASTTGVLSAAGTEPGLFNADHQRLAELLAAIASPWVEVARLNRLSTVDPLTGALNRRGLDETFPEVLATEGPLSVVMADLDHFKRVNDTHGHAAGDEVLRAVASRIAELLRVHDAVVRLGGEEFLMVLPSASLEQASRVAERARESLAGDTVRVGDQTIRITASFGVAEHKEGETRDALLARADRALFEAKKAGRDCVRRA